MTRTSVAQRFPRSGTDRSRRLLIALLAIPFLIGVIGAPVAAPGRVQADELSRAQQQQKDLARKIAAQKVLIAKLNSSQASLAGQISETKDELEGITDNLVATRKKVTRMIAAIEVVKAEYQDLVTQLADLDHQLGNIEDQETAKKAQLGERKAELANRIRDAYEAERTSMLETFLSGASFTDMLARMSTQLDAAEQDQALAAQIAEDRETLLALHQTVEATRGQTNTLRQETAVQKQKLDQRLDELKKAQAKLKKLEKAAKAALARAEAALQAAGRRQEGAAARARRYRGRQAEAGQADRPPRRPPVQHGPHPVQVQRVAALADAGQRDPAVRLHGLRVGAAERQLRPLPQRHRHRRPVRHARSGHPATGASCTSAGTTPTAPTRPGS